MKNKYNNMLLTDQLMLEVAEGKKEAFNTLCNKTYKVIYNYIFSIIRNHTVAEDLLHNTYIAIEKSIKNYKPNNKPMAWIFTIAKNNTYNYYKKQKTEIPIELVKESFIQSQEDIIDNLVLRKLLEKLNEKERSIILLNVVSGYKFKEISSIMQIPLGTVLSSYNRGMKKLRKEVLYIE